MNGRRAEDSSMIGAQPVGLDYAAHRLDSRKEEVICHEHSLRRGAPVQVTERRAT